jgi:ornithine decarboxylase
LCSKVIKYEIYFINNAYLICFSLVLRIRYSSDKAKYKLGKKFGCRPNDEAIELLKLAKNHNLNVVGLSFHIGSSCEDYEVYCEAIKVCKKLFIAASDVVGFDFKILDIGGGFPGNSFERINEFCEKINNSLEDNFPIKIYPDLKVFSEPGRYFVESAFTLLTFIQSRKVIKDQRSGEIQEMMYYLNEGVYSNFLFIPLGPETVEPQLMKSRRSDLKFNTTIWGRIGYLLII